MNIIKRNGKVERFFSDKIVNAITKSMDETETGVDFPLALKIANNIYQKYQIKQIIPTVETIQDDVEEMLAVNGRFDVSKRYILYRNDRSKVRVINTTDKSILSLLDFTNEEVMMENSNKNPRIISTQRDLIAGEVSKDMVKRKLLPYNLVQAHETGKIHIHDMDYLIHPMFNCCLPNIKDMLENGTVINGKKIDRPKSFQVACTVLTQIVAQIASNQYGGQSISSIDTILAPFLRDSYNKHYQKYVERELDEDLCIYYADLDMREDVKNGVQTIQYQINTLMTTNGQSPFLTLLLYFESDYEYQYEASLIQEEILKQRIQGIKNEIGEWITPAFPKLVYILDEHNIHEDSPYYYLTELASICTSKRMYPDYISAKKMREIYDGQIFAPMGCRAFLPPYINSKGEYETLGRFNIGVQTLNLPNIAISSGADLDLFWEIFHERMELIKQMALIRYDLLKNVKSDVSPIHWQHGGISRLSKGESIRKLLVGGFSTVTIGYIGIYETIKYLLGVSHTTKEGEILTLEILNKMSEYKDLWTNETGIQFALYGTPSENTAGRLCELDRKYFGEIKDVTDKGFYTNSYHVDVREDINAFDKLKFESKFQEISTGGAISYIEIPNMQHNTIAILQVIKYMYSNILYAEFNTKLDLCHICRYEGEIIINDDLEWECPNCNNKNQEQMTVVRRTCGYLGENFWSEGRTKDIKARIMHL